MTDYFGRSLYLDGRDIAEPSPAEVANPPTEREDALRREFAAATERCQNAKRALSRVEGGLLHRPVELFNPLTGQSVQRQAPAGVDQGALDDAQRELAAAEVLWDQLNRDLRHEVGLRTRRMAGWHPKRGAA